MSGILKILLVFVTLLLVFSLPAFAQNVFVDMIKSFVSTGVFDLLLFILFFAVFYAILMKSKIIGSNAGLNATIAFITAFLVSFHSAFTGFNLTESLSRFFTQASVIGIVFVIALVIASVFYPDLTKVLLENIKKPTILYIMIPIAIVLFITSGTIGVFWAGYKSSPGVSNDVIIVVVGLLIFVVVLIIASMIGGKK